MITCPWCGTSYLEFQPNCDNCGGSLPLPVESTPVALPAAKPQPTDVQERIPAPPLPPRQVPDNVARRILLTDVGAITGFVFFLLGLVFGVVGVALTIAVITAPVGIPFAGLGFLFFVVGAGLLIWRYQYAQQTVAILRDGQAALGEIVNVAKNYNVQINNRYTWVIYYRFKLHRQIFSGKVNTLSRPDLSQQPGKSVYVLYSQDQPEKSTLYPSPYGYFGL
jgi:hypothetical protein